MDYIIKLFQTVFIILFCATVIGGLIGLMIITFPISIIWGPFMIGPVYIYISVPFEQIKEIWFKDYRSKW